MSKPFVVDWPYFLKHSSASLHPNKQPRAVDLERVTRVLRQFISSTEQCTKAFHLFGAAAGTINWRKNAR